MLCTILVYKIFFVYSSFWIGLSLHTKTDFLKKRDRKLSYLHRCSDAACCLGLLCYSCWSYKRFRCICIRCGLGYSYTFGGNGKTLILMPDGKKGNVADDEARGARQDGNVPWDFLRLFTYIPRRLLVVIRGILMHNNIINPIN